MEIQLYEGKIYLPNKRPLTRLSLQISSRRKKLWSKFMKYRAIRNITMMMILRKKHLAHVPFSDEKN
jgi:hypothetical protein